VESARNGSQEVMYLPIVRAFGFLRRHHDVSRQREATALSQLITDYERVAEAIRFIEAQVAAQPSLAEIADHVHLSPYHFQRLFSRWAGISPKRFLQALTVAHAKQMLDAFPSLLEVSGQLGLSSASRLHDHFVQLEAVTPGEYRRRGAGMDISYGVSETPFGFAFVAASNRGICQLGFLESRDFSHELERLAGSWPEAKLIENHEDMRRHAKSLFSHQHSPDRPLSLLVSGTNFQVVVWRALLNIPAGKLVSYAQLANVIQRPDAVRAVGNAVGANPVAFLIPCHRVIHSSGKLDGYRWGGTRKRALIAWESADPDISQPSSGRQG
jgi:AraC family transcriptional regulator, regulatory protein of adaptative response / methylated-DNA-[protein]-cysteine methyltransferase